MQVFLAALGGLLSLVKALPDIIKTVGEVLKFLREYSDRAERERKAKELLEATKEARTTGSTERLDKLFNSRGVDAKK